MWLDKISGTAVNEIVVVCVAQESAVYCFGGAIEFFLQLAISALIQTKP
jgi:hypothetical protein